MQKSAPHAADCTLESSATMTILQSLCLQAESDAKWGTGGGVRLTQVCPKGYPTAEVADEQAFMLSLRGRVAEYFRSRKRALHIHLHHRQSED